ncbi:hypothetical protein [Spiroplasma taiwanense]|nr:hypothetical protein [Spiroplasma taiwanense]
MDLEKYFMKYYQNEIKKDIVNTIEKHSEKISNSKKIQKQYLK